MGVPTMSVAGPRDDDYARVSRDGSRRRIAVVAVVVIALALASVGGASWYAGRQDAQIAGEPPLIRAEPGLTKQRPAEAGGLEVPHQDVLVFEQLTPTAPSEPRVERLLPRPEAPVPPVTLRAAPPLALDTAAGAAPPAVAQEAAAPVVGQPAPQAPAATTVVTVPTPPRPVVSIETMPIPAPPETASAPVPTAAPVAPVATAEAVPAEPAPAQAAPVAPPAGAPTEVAVLPAAGSAVVAAGWRVQIGSFRDRQAGEGEWTRLQQKHADMLGGLALHVQRANLARGTFYRIQVGAFESRDAADTLCGQLKSRNQDCLVVQP